VHETERKYLTSREIVVDAKQLFVVGGAGGDRGNEAGRIGRCGYRGVAPTNRIWSRYQAGGKQCRGNRVHWQLVGGPGTAWTEIVGGAEEL